MAIGTYGTKRLADVDPVDMDIYVIYSSDRNADSEVTINQFSGSDVITPVSHTTNTDGNTQEILGGLYNMQLNSDIFNEIGVYTIHIRPAQIRTTINDCGSLSTFPNNKGLVFDTNNVPNDFVDKFTNNGLDGYRIEYLSNNGEKIQNLYRIITSSFLVEPVNANTTNSSQKSIRYSYNDSGSLLYCTITPNTAPTFRPTQSPFIGVQGQSVILSNTNFNPITFEVEMVEYDMESIALGLYGEQSKSIDDGIYTIYDSRGNIYAQYNLFEVRSGTNEPLYEVRTKRNDIDRSKILNNITNQGNTVQGQ